MLVTVLVGTRFYRKYGGSTELYDYKIVDVNIRRIRNKIEEDPSKPKYILTAWGYGYTFRRAD
ncbi:winged helix-turn-helix domain-containing protein [Peptostreptococcus stomatis]|uniref:winged helix-turn-helix domain-containing protein n=1 Tax=Peptostreptococcus stomatis TaxID=341694 RepID=UPI0002F691D6